MKRDNIQEIKIDETGRLCVTPSNGNFGQIFRSAMEIHWDTAGSFLYSPVNMKDWKYIDWYRQIVKAVKEEYGCLLIVTDETNWVDVPEDIEIQIIQCHLNS